MIKESKHTVHISAELLTGLIVNVVSAHKFHDKLPAGEIDKVILIIPSEVTMPRTGEVIKVETEEAIDTRGQLRAEELDKSNAAVSTSSRKQSKSA